jgi:hypothetical protein
MTKAKRKVNKASGLFHTTPLVSPVYTNIYGERKRDGG